MDFEKFLKDFCDHQLNGVELGFIAKIVKFDKIKMRAEIKPLLRSITHEDGPDKEKIIDTPNIDNVPVSILYSGGYYIRPAYVSGDMVHVACTASNIQQPIDSDLRSDMMFNRFHLNYCVVTGAVIPKAFQPPASWAAKTGLLIGRETDFIHVKNSGGFEVVGDLVLTGDLNVIGKITATGNIEATGDVKAGPISLLTHTHIYITPPIPGPPAPTGPPLP